MSSALFTGRVPRASFRRIDELLKREPKRVGRELKGALAKWGGDWEKRVQDRFGGSLRGPSDTLRNRTNSLRGSLGAKVSGSSLADLKLRCFGGGAKAPHAPIQEFGGVVKPKNAKYLTIPTEANLTSAGRPRFASARAFIEGHKDETFFFRAKNGGLLLMWKNPNGPSRKLAQTATYGSTKARVVAMFALKTSVEIPGPKAPTKKQKSRLGFYDSWHDLGPERVHDLQKIARGAGSG